MELPKTEAELQAILENNTKEVTEGLTAKHNSEMANMRKKHADELAKAKEQANMTAEELAKQKVQEQQEADHKELEELRAYKKQSIISEKLAEAKLPQYFKNDNRLLNAEAGDYDKVIKSISKEYTENLPKGSNSSTVVQTYVGGAEKDAKTQAYESFGKALEQAIKE